MDENSVTDRWMVLRSEARSWWEKLSEADLGQVSDIDSLTSLLQDRYGYNREAIVLEINRRIAEYEAELKNKVHSNHAK
jgi:hypothetical protein